MRRVIVLLAILSVAVAGGLWWFASAKRERERVQLQRLTTLKTVGLGYLENDRPAESVAAFEEIAWKLPQHRLGPRNLAVARLMILDETDRGRDPERWQAVFAEARTAVDLLREVDPEAAESYVIAARIEAIAGDLPQALELLRHAAALAEGVSAAPIWFEMYLTARDAEAAELKAEGGRALGHAYRLASDNSAVLLEWLSVQAATEDPAIIATLERAETVLLPLDRTVRERVRVSLVELLEQAKTAAADRNWQEAERMVRMVVNVARPEEMVQSDRTEVDRNALEFAVIDFPDEFYDHYGVSRSVAGEPIEVQFLEEADWQLPTGDEASEAITIDFDLDGSMDVVVLRDQQVTVHSRDADPNAWRTVASADLPSGFSSIIAADLDDDAATGGVLDERFPHSADVDLIVYGEAGILLLENHSDASGERTLKEVELPADLPQPRAVRCAVAADFDQDGDLDLFLSSDTGVNIWSNRGEFRFLAWPADALQGTHGLQITGATAVDWDRDVDLDLIVTASDSPSSPGYFENLRHGRMRWRSFADLNDGFDTATTVKVIDADGNASWDLLAGGPQGIMVATTKTPATGRVIIDNVRASSDFAAGNMIIVDYDNDGVEDVFAFNDRECILLRHLGNGRLVPSLNSLPDSYSGVTSGCTGDIDQDGDLDLLLVKNGQVKLLRNHGGNTHHWVDVTLLAQQVKGTEAQASGRVNQYGIGSLLELKVGPVYQPRVVRSAVTHFGLADREEADVVRVVWTSGIPQNIMKPRGGQLITERQSLKGSCPYLYAWSGDQFEFVTDLLWSSPLGLQTADGRIAKDRPWEWLKVSADQLRPIDGEYRLQITEELWEAAYFDQVELIAVDHPAEVEIFTNEKVGPAELASPHAHVVAERRLPRSARDSSGADVMELIGAEDDRYLRAFKTKYRQGYVDPHFIEFDLGPLDDPAEITLFMTGWIYPTDTSINVQISQNHDLDGPRPPYLMVPDGLGGWKTERDFIGFPGGKTKTIAIDLSGVFPENDHRFRICTSAEIYWDAVFFTVDQQQSELVHQPLSLKSADLHHRGVSEPVVHEGHGPERYDYQRVSQAPAWPPMSGRFTRYGDVTELVRETDDLLVVLGSGDEMTLRFATPEHDVPTGWKRDFILHNVGWDKDADLNTVYGQSPEPLPFRSMSAYPTPPGENPPDSPLYRNYLRRYQTRRQPDATFRQWVRGYQGQEIE